MDEAQLDSLCREAWSNYEYLRDNDLTAQSGTSRRLRSGDLASLRVRLAEELIELGGVVEGTHVHDGFPQDLVLEGYEVFYWAVCLAIGGNVSYEQAQPANILASAFKQPARDREVIWPEYSKLAASVLLGPPDLPNIIQTLLLIGYACATGPIDPGQLLERDLTEMRQKPYLAR